MSMRILLVCLIVVASVPLSSCAQASRTDEGFRNNYPHQAKGSFWKWQWERLNGSGAPPPPGGWQFDAVKPDVAFLKRNRTETTVTWIGHATFLVQAGGLNILIDPHLTERASPLSWYGPRRVAPLPLDFDELPHIDAVLISHNHYDHLDLGTVSRLNDQPGGAPRFLVGLGLKAWFADVGIDNVEELDWWQSRELKGVTMHFTPVQHWSRRSLNDTNRTLWGGWVIDAPGFCFLHTGDTGYSRDFKDVAKRFPRIDLAAIPIGAYAPRWFMQVMHVNPDEAVRIFSDLKASRAIAMHWGTFESLTDEPMDEPPRELAKALQAAGIASERFIVLKHGETLKPLPETKTRAND
jgi:N-acyl-phosphatidylethanolamine-hydrolysing phospholipase D